MERIITVVNPAADKSVELSGDFNTLRDVKQALNAQSFSFSGMEFREGISRTLLIEDDTILPSNLMYRGQETNNLVIVLSPGKIKSGAISRSEVYNILNDLPGAKEAIKEAFGKNFTQVSTNELINFIDDFSERTNAPAVSAPSEEVAPTTIVASSVESSEEFKALQQRVSKMERVLKEVLKEINYQWDTDFSLDTTDSLSEIKSSVFSQDELNEIVGRF